MLTISGRVEFAEGSVCMGEVAIVNSNPRVRPQACGRLQGRMDLTQSAGALEVKEWVVIVNKVATGNSLGMDVRKDIKNTLWLVTRVTGGLIGQWNQENPTKRVKKGDLLIRVNEVSGSATRMIEETQRAGKLEILVRRQDVRLSSVSENSLPLKCHLHLHTFHFCVIVGSRCPAHDVTRPHKNLAHLSGIPRTLERHSPFVSSGRYTQFAVGHWFGWFLAWFLSLRQAPKTCVCCLLCNVTQKPALVL